jgi:hypothetical protein
LNQADGDDSPDDFDDASGLQAGEPESNEASAEQQPDSGGQPDTTDAAEGLPDDGSSGGVAEEWPASSVMPGYWGT